MGFTQEIQAREAALTEDQFRDSEQSEARLDEMSLEYGVLGTMSEGLKRTFTICMAEADRIRDDMESVKAQIPYAMDEESHRRIANVMGWLKEELDIHSKIFWRDVRKEFPDSADWENLAVIDGFRLAWYVKDPCYGCRVRAGCESRFGKDLSPDERHRKMQEEGVGPFDLLPPDDVLGMIGKMLNLGMPLEQMDGGDGQTGPQDVETEQGDGAPQDDEGEELDLEELFNFDDGGPVILD